MSFLYKRLAKLGKIAAQKDIEEKYDFPKLLLKKLSLEELNYIRTIPPEQLKTNKRFAEIYGKYK